MRFLPYLVSLLVLAVALPARAQTAKWSVTRASEANVCPDGDTLADAVREARDGAPFGPTRVIVAFTRGEAGYEASVRVGRGVRVLSDTGASCAALKDAVVATIVVLLDEAEQKREPAPPPPASPLEIPPAAPSQAKEEPFSSLRIGATAHAGYTYFHRTSTAELTKDGFEAGFEARVFPHSRHGFLLGFTSAGGVFGPSVQIYDVAYTYAIVEPRPLDGPHFAVYADLGAAYGVVTNAEPAPDHKVLGARATLDMDLLIWNGVIGITGGYHGGVPLGGPVDGWEGAFTATLHLGLLLDFGATGK